MSKKRGSGCFNRKWLVECGIEVTEYDPETKRESAVVCLFCKTFGKEEPLDSSNRKRKRSATIHFFKLPWRPDKMKEHHKTMHPFRWTEYQSLSQHDKKTYFSHSTHIKKQLLPTLDATKKLRLLLESPGMLSMPCCYDGLSAKLIERAGFKVTFMTGFGVSAVHGYPDTQLLSYAEMLRAGRDIVSSLNGIPCIGDGDTGYGNALNVKRTVKGYAQAGLAGIMIEDQLSPKRCGHTKGKMVVSREEAFMRIQAAVDARNEGKDIVIIARTDSRGTHGMEEAIFRCKEFMRLGADVTFLEAPESEEEMLRYCHEVPGFKLANMLENGLTPILPTHKLEQFGFKLAAYPLTLLAASIKTMQHALEAIKVSDAITINNMIPSFAEVKDVVGFESYYEEENRYNERHYSL